MFPTVIVPSNEALKKEWMNKWGSAIVNSQGSHITSRFQRLHANRQVYYGNLDSSEFKYVTQAYGIRTPARLVGYPFVYKLVEALVGETSGDTLDFSVECVDDEIIAAKLEKRVQAATHVLTLPLRKMLGSISKEDLFGDEEMAQELPDSIEALDSMNFHDNVEVGMMWVMRHLQQKYDLDIVFEEGMREMAINYEEFYRVYVKNGDPQIEFVNPSRITYGGHESLRWLQDAPWIRDEQNVPIAQVIDEYRHVLTSSEIAEFTKWMNQTLELSSSQTPPWGKYGRYEATTGELVLTVIRYEWKAIEQFAVKESPNKWDPARPFLKILPDGDAGPNATYKSFNMMYQGVFIGGRHLAQGQRPDQVRKNDDYAKTHASYFGCVKQGLSVVDATKNLYQLLCITMYHIEAMLNRAGGKAIVYDIAQKPKKMQIEDVFYHMKETGMVLINTAEEGHQLSRGFNQFQQVDFTLSQSINQLFALKGMLEETMMSITGINPARTGEGHHEETARNTQQKLVQSSFITQSMFNDHFKVIQDVLNEMLNLTKIAWAHDNNRVITVFGDRGRETIKLMSDWLGHHYGLFVKNSQKERAKKKNVMALGEAALSSGQIDFMSILTMSNKSNSKEIERVFKKGMRTMQKQSAAGNQAQMQQAEADRQLKYKEIESRIIAARIEAGAYVETKRLEISAKYGLADQQSMTKLAEVAEQSRGALDAIVQEAATKAEVEATPGGQEQGGEQVAEVSEQDQMRNAVA